jgi:hypothetical protein
MLDLRTLDPDRQAADRRVAIVAALGLVGVGTAVSLAGGGGVWALAAGGALALAALPWLLAFSGRASLLDDAIAGVPFCWRGQRAGVWATAPPAGALLALFAVAALGVGGTALGLLACTAGAAGYTALIARAERAYERAVYLDLTVLELRFQRITATRATRAAPPAATPR